MAGSSLEAGAKIYSSRVDALHLQAIQVHDQVSQIDRDGLSDLAAPLAFSTFKHIHDSHITFCQCLISMKHEVMLLRW